MEFMSRALELAGIYFTTGVRWFFLILSIFILADPCFRRAIRLRSGRILAARTTLPCP